MAVRGFGLRAAEATGPGEYFYGCDWKPGDAVTEALAWLVCRGLRPLSRKKLHLLRRLQTQAQ
eukprot:9256587-Alexandrium_andersonii.AAC.1